MITFTRALLDKVLTGEKTQTRRLWKRPRCRVGSIHEVRCGQWRPCEGHIRILRVWQEQLGDISETDAVAEGFDDPQLPGYARPSFLHYVGCYDNVSKDTLVWVVEFELVKEVEK